MHAVVRAVHDDRVVGDFQFVEQVEQLADVLVVVDHRVVVRRLPAPGLADAPSLGVRAEVHVRRVHPGEEGLAALVLARDEVRGGLDEVVVARLHPLAGQWSGVLDGLLADPSPPWVLGLVVLPRRTAVEHAAGAEALPELRESVLARVVGILGVLLGVEVVEVAEELVEAVRRGQVRVEVSEVVLAELAGGVAVVFQQVGDRRILGLQPDRRSRDADLAQPGAEHALAGDER